MTREEAIEEINKVFEPAFANYIITALTEGVTVSDKTLEQESCEDCISRSDMLDAIGHGTTYTSEDLQRIIKVLPSVTPKPKTEWIPVSERLPNEFADVLCNTDSEEIFIATYLGKMNDGTDCFDDNDGMMWEGDVIAWMPLPEPYKSESEDKE